MSGSAPPAAVRLAEFGENGIGLELLVWSDTLVHRKGRLTSLLNFAIYEKLAENGIEIPYPQRDVSLRGGNRDAAIDHGLLRGGSARPVASP